ncbi:putative membrane protein [Rhodovulum imhoffii]|uniref:Putative membrane protein n=1 Tax=Rhodovulum imhoffii TaxID=365340 RepID=A0A2T5BS90_9RHOB|nr:DUF1269 domain-containing protein [Rhodovulum imhoffii]MBK5933534.1 hypothetical protein [Rhodovulum imhoffii]PTN02111.1 putative membrane protein [Rhodovulum imhoffii]
MSKLIAITFDDAATAFDMKARLVSMQDDYLLQLDDIVVVTNEEGKPRLHQATDLTTLGAINGGWWGMFIGLIFLNPLLGMAVGAASGALGGRLADIGIDDRFMKDVGQTLKNGKAAVFVLVRDLTQDKVLDGIEAFRGKGNVFTTSLSQKDENALREALEAA